MSLIEEALDLLRRYGDVFGVNWDEAPGLLDRAASGITNLAGSPILAAAQVAIGAMKVTTGSGEPQAGEAFEKSAKLFEEAGDLLIDATPKEGNWDGTAAETYKKTNDNHRHLTLEVAAADGEMHSALSGLASRVSATRTDLQDAIDFLADYDTSTAWMNAIPGGAAIKAAADLGVAATQLGEAEASMAKLVAASTRAAHEMRTPLGRYGAAAQEPVLDAEGTFPCGEPFGDERTTGDLPTRTDPDHPYSPPETDRPPVIYPPAKPNSSPAPR